MLALSGAFHLFVAILALAAGAFRGTPIRLEPVAVVNLVGGVDLPGKTAERPGAPKAAEKAAPTTKKAEKAPAPPPKSATRAASKKRAPEVARANEFTTSKKRVPPDTASVNERLREMRRSRAEAEAVRKAVEEHRQEAAARAAVRGVGERVAHRIEGPQGQGGGAAGFGGGSQGNVRVSPELLDYFRKLERRVRESWVLPETLRGEATKLTVEVVIVIEKDGRVSDARIVKGSGNEYFDESVRRAIRKASPLPVPPERLRGGEDYYEVGFRFHGTGGEQG
ncbi:MAG: energy transducer TonB [Verrucomicrobiota bacterium]